LTVTSLTPGEAITMVAPPMTHDMSGDNLIVELVRVST
jgi:hypothetical protein